MVLFVCIRADGKIIEQEAKTTCRYCLGRCVSPGEIERFYVEKMRDERNADEQLLKNPRAMGYRRMALEKTTKKEKEKRGVGRPRKDRLKRPGKSKKNTAPRT